jgi:peroxiredoxin Q/BCP
MAQLRHDHQKFIERDAVIVVVGPENQDAFRRYWKEHKLPFIGLPDPDHTVLRKYGQEVNLSSGSFFLHFLSLISSQAFFALVKFH